MKAFITVMGHDTVGVVAKVSTLCSELNINIEAVSYTHLTLPTKRIVYISVDAASLKKKNIHISVDYNADTTDNSVFLP